MKANHNYGYKVCYKEKGTNTYIRFFIVYTHEQAKLVVNCNKKYPTYSRSNNRLLNCPKWKIFPISKSEVIAGIWREAPF